MSVTAESSILAAALVDALRDLLPARDGPIPLHEPCFGGREWDYLKDCLDSGWVSSAGRYVELFEARLAEVCGCCHAVAVNNGTAALHVALELAGVGQDDEVLIPSLTFVATANAVSYCGALPHFVDSEPTTLGLDPGRLDDYLAKIAETRGGRLVNRQTGRRLAAIVPMHTFGHPVDMDALLTVAERFRLPVVEDATESLGSRYRGRPTGALGRLGTLSFNGNKIVTTGGGGAILTDDGELAARARHLTTTAKVTHRWAYLHDAVGYNYRLPNLNAALGLAQLEQLESFLAAKRGLAERYRTRLAGIPGLSFVVEPAFAKSNYWLNAMLLDPERANERDALLEATNSTGFLTRPAWRPMHLLEIYAGCPRMPLPVAEDLERRLINLPSGPALGLDHVA